MNDDVSIIPALNGGDKDDYYHNKNQNSYFSLIYFSYGLMYHKDMIAKRKFPMLCICPGRGL